MGGLFLRLRTWWETADRTQKVVTIFGGTFLLLLLGGVFYFGSRPKMALAYGGLTPGDQGKVVAEVQKMGIPVEYDLRGGVLVPSDKVAEVQATLSRNGAAPTSGHLGNEGLSEIGMMSTKNVEDARLKAIREGEIAKSIEVIGGVASARVLLSGGEKSPFAGEDEPSSASITITESVSGSIGPNEAKAIASLAAKSVPGLTTKNVTVVNQEGATLFDGALEQGHTGKYTAKIEAQNNEANRVKRELQSILDNAFGANSTLITARAEMDFDDRKVQSKLPKISSKPVARESVWEGMGKGAASKAEAMGTSGLSSNTLAPAENNGAGGEGKEYGTAHARDEFANGEIIEHNEKAPGTVTSLSVSVLANSEKITDIKPVEALIEGYLDPKTHPTFTYKVTSTKFDTAAQKEIAKAAAATGSREQMQQMLSLLPIGALILVAFVVIKALGKAAKSENVLIQALPDGRLVTLGGKPGASLPAGLTTRRAVVDGSGVTYAEEPDSEEDIYEEVEDEAGKTTWKPKKRKKGPKLEDIEDIPDQVNVPLEQIKKMGNERPGVAAMLIKSWLITD